jgi:hypothetical protein
MVASARTAGHRFAIESIVSSNPSSAFNCASEDIYKRSVTSTCPEPSPGQLVNGYAVGTSIAASALSFWITQLAYKQMKPDTKLGLSRKVLGGISVVLLVLAIAYLFVPGGTPQMIVIFTMIILNIPLLMLIFYYQWQMIKFWKSDFVDWKNSDSKFWCCSSFCASCQSRCCSSCCQVENESARSHSPAAADAALTHPQPSPLPDDDVML